MCGIIAYIGNHCALNECLQNALINMRNRGPDYDSIWKQDDIWMGHNRLAIIDIDTRSAQPMHSNCGRFTIVYNGEIYNFRDLRYELGKQGVKFLTTSDTEVLLTLFAREGVSMLSKLQGMFAFVIWDKVEQVAFAARDPYGIKPLYMAKTLNGVIVASQVKAILATGLVSKEPDPIGHAGYWMLGSVPEPNTWYRDIRALPAGSYAWFKDGKQTSVRSWFDVGQIWRDAKYHNIADIQDQVSCIVASSVKRHLVSDVPLGVFLSGGIDSGVMAVLMKEAGIGDLVGVTITYDEYSGKHQDEAPVAALLANQCGIKHHIRRVTRSEFESDLPRILNAMDQPTIDGVNTWYASKAVAELGLKVVVSGLGGDELFQGYSHFQTLPRLLRFRNASKFIPGSKFVLSQVGKWQSHRTKNRRWQYFENWAKTIEGAWWLRRSIHTPEELPFLMGADLADAAIKDFDPVLWVRRMTGELSTDPMLALGQVDSMTYMRNQLLRDSDWASMDHSVELRTPLVDSYLLMQMQPLLPHFHRYRSKTLLANAPQLSLPSLITKRKKTGFGIPIDNWLMMKHDKKPVNTNWMSIVAKA